MAWFWHDVYVNCIAELNVCFLQLQKNFCKITCLLLSFDLFLRDPVILFLWFILLEFPWLYFTTTKINKKYPGKIWFQNPQLGQSENKPSLKRVQYPANTENQMYSTLTIRSVVTYPSAMTMTKSLCYHHRLFSKHLRNRKCEGVNR